MAESLAAKSSKDKSAEQSQMASCELAPQPMSGSLYGSILTLQRSAGNRAVAQLMGLTPNTTPSSKMLLQRKCASCAVANGECAECKKKNDERHGFSQSKPIQAKLTISKPGDKYEQEADRIADDIVARSAFNSPRLELEKEAETRITPFVQRQIVSEDELEEPEPPGEEEEEEEVIQAKSESGDQMREFGYPESDVESELRVARGGGKPLPDDVKTSMEEAFGANLSAVRVHTDTRADSLSGSLNALAFTTGTDIFFRSASFDPSGSQGRRLLAHELTHVVQQNPQTKVAYSEDRGPASGARRPTPGPHVAVSQNTSSVISSRSVTSIQRDDDEPKKKGICGHVEMYDSAGNKFYTKDKGSSFERDGGDCPPLGIYPYEVFQEGGAFKVRLRGDVYTLKKYPSDLPELLKKAQIILLVVSDPDFGLKDPYSTVVVGTPGEKGKEGEEKEGEEGEASAAEKKGGSKYGVFGLLNLPDWATKALEAALKALGDEEELLALTDLLRALRDLSDNIDEFKALFADTDKLLEVALGIQESAAIDKLEAWVSKPSTKRKLAVKKAKNKGIIGVARKVLNIIAKVKNILRPLFKARATVKGIIGVAGAAVSEAEAFEEIFERREEIKSSPEALDELLTSLSSDLSKTISQKLDGLRASFKMRRESFTEAEFVSSEELARVIVDALIMMVPGPAKVIAKAAQKIGLEGAIADNFIAPILPKAALDAINDQLRNLTKVLDDKFVAAIEGDLDKILTDFESKLQEHLIPEIKSAVISLSPKSGGQAGAPVAGALLEMKKSRGEVLPDDLRRDMESEFDSDFANVSIHRDAPAQKASEALRANAFTMGSKIFFGPGRFAPDSIGGRRLLAHELAHVVQQSNGAPAGHIQRDYKSVLDKLVKKFGSAVTSSLSAIGKPSAEKREKAEKILKKVKALVGKTVRSITDPALPAEAYVYTRVDKKKKPRGIRRKTNWLGLLPALSIVKSKIQLGLLSRLDPKAKDRAALRAALGCDSKKKKEEAHHIIPLERTSHPVVKLAAKNGFGVNSAKNGICLLPTTHRGSHPKYTKFITQVLDALRTQNPSLVWDAAFAKKFDQEIAGLRKKLDGLNKAKRSIEEIK